MTYVTDSITFRTGQSTPLATFAGNANKVRSIILASGMVQLTSLEWPGQMDDVVTGTASGSDVSLDSLSYAVSATTEIGFWVFKHPTRNLYVKVQMRLRTSTTDAVPQVLLLNADVGNAILSGGGFSGGSVTANAINTLSYVTKAGMINSFPVGAFNLFCYCGASGFWLYADGGSQNYQAYNANSLYSFQINGGKRALISIVALCNPAGDTWIVLTPPETQTNAASNWSFSTPMAAANPAGVQIAIRNMPSAWTALRAGSLGDLPAPEVMSSDVGVRVAQGRIFGIGSGAPVPMPIGIAQATLTEVVARLDLDGAGERNFLPVPAMHCVQMRAPNLGEVDVRYAHTCYLLPASDD